MEKLEPLDLQPTKRVADLYQELVNEVLKMFALENYQKKLQDELSTIKEAKEEKYIFMQAGREQIGQFQNNLKMQYEMSKDNLAIQHNLMPPKQ
jgi:hypothetical protein